MNGRIFVSTDGYQVVGAYCSRVCAEKRAMRTTSIKSLRMPTTVRGLTGYALNVLSCDECGDNLRDGCES